MLTAGSSLIADMPTGLLEKERRSERRWSIGLAALLVVAVTSMALLATAVVYFGHSVCNPDVQQLLAERRRLRYQSAAVWTTAGAVFLARSAGCWLRDRRAWPWLAVAAAVLLLALREALFAEPTVCCVF